MIDWLHTQFGFSVALMVVLVGVILLIVAYSVLAERKVSAWMQDRYGPNRVGPRGLLQPIADGVKALLKEDVIPGHVDKPLFLLAPALLFAVAMLGFAIIPWGGQITFGDGRSVHLQVASLDIGLLYILAVGSLSVYGIVLGAWASNNKYSFYGGMRAAAQMLSYEIPLGLAILVIVLTSGELRLEGIVARQVETTWNVFLHPVAFLLLLVAAFAETNRTPFDLPECEQELIAGYHTEYSSMKLALFFLSEYAHMVTNSALIVALFFGGWQPLPWVPWLADNAAWWGGLLQVAVYFVKVLAFIFFYIWIRWTLPRFRFDQLMRLAWKGMVPLSLAVVVLAACLAWFGDRPWWKPGPISVWAPIGEFAVLAVVLLIAGAAGGPVTGRQSRLRAVTE